MTSAAEELAKSLLSFSHAAEVLGVDAQHVYRAFARGKLHGLEIDGSKFIEIASLHEYIAARTPVTATNRENSK